ncbi:MAG: type III pantothenate kinase [Bacteroidales bacterium]|nr:type III pantothenate kinase [Bacteroidales bacterium]
MYNLVVDAGNTSIKMFLFENGEIAHCLKCSTVDELLPTLESAVPMGSIAKCIVSSVSIGQETIAGLFRPFFPIMLFDSSLRFPITIRYGTPNTLGSDRVAAVVGAAGRYPMRNVLVIDSGTAITYDIVTAQGEYLGGNISPGLNTRFRALHNFTGKLPLLKVDNSMEGLFGTNTNEAIGLGVQNGILYEVEATIREFAHRFDDLLVVFTGGDSFFFENRIKFSNFAEPYLVAIGLNEILEYNA